ncbi:MAG: hypothetical protein J6Y97_02330, partial [Prevotella sp.]|nr:hypothetical protein [Prevotella sp.]
AKIVQIKCNTKQISYFLWQANLPFLSQYKITIFTMALESFFVISLKGVCDRQQNLRQIRKASFLSVANVLLSARLIVSLASPKRLTLGQENKNFVVCFAFRSLNRIFAFKKQRLWIIDY